VTFQTTQTPEATTYVFSPRELQRLAVYRAAIAAHFYTDECEPMHYALRQPITRANTLRRTSAHAPII
jgi:hypothetical protein